jgi:hypothetical protein
MLEVLNNCFEESESQVLHISNISQDHNDLSNFSVEQQNEVSKTVFETKISIIIPFTKFLPLINEIKNIFYEIIELEAAEHNKRTCEILKKRVYAAESALRDLRIKDKENSKDFFNSKNYLSLQNLSTIIMRIKKFILEISQMRSLIKYIRAESVEKFFIELCKEFDSCVNVLSFPINVQVADELEQFKADQEDLVKVRLKNWILLFTYLIM